MTQQERGPWDDFAASDRGPWEDFTPAPTAKTSGADILAFAGAILGDPKPSPYRSPTPTIQQKEIPTARKIETTRQQQVRNATNMAGSVFAEPAPDRTLGELASDTYARGRAGVRSVAGGLVELANTPQHAINLVNTAANGYAQMLGIDGRIPMLPSYDWVRGTQAELGRESEQILGERTPAALRQSAEFGMVDGIAPTLGYLATNPGELVGTLAEQAPQFLAAGLPGGVGAKLAGAGAFAGGQTASQVAEENQRRVASGELTQAEADAMTAQAAAGSAVVNTVLPRLIPGGTVLEEAMAGARGTLTRGRGAALGLLGEGASGFGEEAFDQAIQNEATGRPLGEGVLKAGALGAILEGPIGGAAGFLSNGREPVRTNAIDPEALAAGNATLVTPQAPNAAPREPSQPAPIVPLGDAAVAPEPTADLDALIAANLPPAAPAPANPSIEGAGVAATPNIDWNAAAAALGIDPGELGAAASSLFGDGTTPAPVLDVPRMDAELGAPAPVLDTERIASLLGLPSEQAPAAVVAAQGKPKRAKGKKPAPLGEPVHTDAGITETATPAVIAESASTAEAAPRVTMAEAKDTLLGKIDAAIANPGKSDFVSLDVPGDGKFKIANTTERLQEFRDQVQRHFRAPANNPVPRQPSLKPTQAQRNKIMAEAETVPEQAAAPQARSSNAGIDAPAVFRDAYLKSYGQERALPDESYARNAADIMAFIEAKNADALRTRNFGDPKASAAGRAVFEAATGIKLPQGRKATEAAIDAWAGITPEQRAAKVQARKDSLAADAAERNVASTRRGAMSVAVNIDGTGEKMDGADYVDGLIAKGLNQVVQRGPATYLVGADGRGFKLPHKLMAAYARAADKDVQAAADRLEASRKRRGQTLDQREGIDNLREQNDLPTKGPNTALRTQEDAPTNPRSQMTSKELKAADGAKAQSPKAEATAAPTADPAIEAAIAEYGYTLKDGKFVTPSGKETSVSVSVSKGRARVVRPDGSKLWTGSPANVGKFLEAFWMAEKKPAPSVKGEEQTKPQPKPAPTAAQAIEITEDQGRVPMSMVADVQSATGFMASTMTASGGVARFRMDAKLGDWTLLTGRGAKKSAVVVRVSEDGTATITEERAGAESIRQEETGITPANWTEATIRFLNTLQEKPEPVRAGVNAKVDAGPLESVEPAMRRRRSGFTADERGANFIRWSGGAPVVSSAEAMNYEFRTGDPVVVDGFHGAKRPDRIGKGFDRKRATSGPMAYFTSDTNVASNYATGKNDTSLAYEDTEFASWFKVKLKGMRSAVPIDRAWWSFPNEVRQRIAELAPRIHMDDDASDIVLGEEGETNGIGNYEWELRQARGNHLKALVESWLTSGSIYGEEQKFMDVLAMAGVPMDGVTYDSPHAEYPSVFPVHIRMRQPLVSTEIPQDVMDALEAAAKRDRSRVDHGADAWDKRTTTLREWVADMKAGNEYVWTRIPDKVTDVFKSLGYDSIIDMGGKGGGATHRVYIPFSEGQVKGKFNKGGYDESKRDLLESAEESRRRGEEAADLLEIRDAVDAAVGPGRVIYLTDHTGLPDRLRAGVESRMAKRGGKGRTAALYDPQTKQVYLFTDVVSDPKRAVWHALHELAGHHGLREFLGSRLDRALEMALQNPTVRAVAEAIASERGIDMRTQSGRLLAAEEALAELAAAVRTENYREIERRYGVEVGEGIRARVAAAVENFLRRLKAALDDLFGNNAFTDEDVRGLLEAAWQAARNGGEAAIGQRDALESAESGPFGPIYDNTDFESAIDALLDGKSGEIRDGLFHPSIGPVDVIYGEAGTEAKNYEDGYGLAKILAKHPEVYVHNLADELLRAGDPVIRGNTATFDTPTYTMVVKRDWKGDQKNWLLTAFEPKEAPTSGRTRIGAAVTGAEARSRQEAGMEDSSTDGGILESVEATPAFDAATATGAAVLRNGHLLSAIDAIKAAGGDLAAITDAVKARDGAALVRALDDALSAARPAPRVTGLKNAVTDAEREAAGRDPILREAVKSNEATVYQAMRAVKNDPLAGPEAVARLESASTEGISVSDAGVMLVYKVELMNARNAAEKVLTDAGASETAKQAARQAWEEAEAKIAAVDMAAKRGGSEWGRFGQFWQRMMREDFTLAALERKERARLERPLTAEESATVKAMADKIADLQAKYDALQARVANAESESAYEGLTREMRRPPRHRASPDSLRHAAEAARRRIREAQGVPSRRGQSGAIISPAVFYDYAVIGAYHIANGAARFSDWVAAMRADIGDAFDRIKAEHPNIFKAAQKELEKPIRSDATVAEVLEKIDPANLKPSDVRNLAKAHIGEGLRGEPALIEAMASDLGIAPDEVRSLFVQSDTQREPTMSEAKQELQNLRKYIALQNEIDRLEAGIPKPPRAAPRPDSPAVAAKKQELADLRKKLRPVRDPEGRYQEMRGKQIQKRIDELKDRIARGDFATKPRVPRALSEANERLAFELDKAKMDFLRHQFYAEMANRTKLKKVGGFIKDAADFSRASKGSFDVSSFLRQAASYTASHPILSSKTFAKSLKVLFSPVEMHAQIGSLSSRPNWNLYKKAGVFFSEAGSARLSKTEEAFGAAWADYLPHKEGEKVRNALRAIRNVATSGIRASERQFVTYLDLVRADFFDLVYAGLADKNISDKELKHLGKLVNAGTGRGRIFGKHDDAGEIVNSFIWSPRLFASRLMLATGWSIWTAPTRRMQLLAAKEAGRTIAGLATAYTLAVFAFGIGHDDEDDPLNPKTRFDPRSSDFMKIVVGDTRIDMLAGMSQVIVFLTRLGTGETVTKNGEVKALRSKLLPLETLRRWYDPAFEPLPMGDDGELKWGSRDSWDVITDLVRGKLSPPAAAFVNTVTSSKPIPDGKPWTPGWQIVDLFTPLPFTDTAESISENGVSRGGVYALMAQLGMSVNTYRQTDKQAFAEFTDRLKAVRTDVKDRLSKVPLDEWQSEFDAMKEEYGPVMEGMELQYYKRDGEYGKKGEPRRDKYGKAVIDMRLSDRSDYDDGKEGTQVNHLIPDSLVRHHPMMKLARDAGYDLNNPNNLLPMPDKPTEGEIYHKGDHPKYTTTVFGALNAEQKRLKRKYGRMDKVPADELLDAVRRVEDDARKRIEAKDVPVEDGRLAGMPMRAAAAV